MSTEQSQVRRVTRSKADAMAAYDRMSRWYNLTEGVWEKGLRDVALRKLGVRNGERVLEIGSGPGQDLLALAGSVGQTGRVCGVDLSSGMARLAHTGAAKKGLAHQVDLVQGDAEFLPFKARAFDAALMSFTLELFDTPDIPLVLLNIREVLCPAGRLCVASLSKAGQSSLMRDLYEWGHDSFPSLLDCRPIFVQAFVEGAGFQILDVTRKSLFGLPVEIVLAGNPGSGRQE
jgi:demethylmenaquinone methyltransferase/2-methoxy-6-polyprenyl-1,4-benzoquinol methylase